MSKSSCLCFQFAGRRGVAGSLEWAGTGEGGGQGDGGEEERPELDAEVKLMFNLMFSASTKLTPEQRLWDVVGALLCHHTSTQLFSIPCSVLFRKNHILREMLNFYGELCPSDNIYRVHDNINVSIFEGCCWKLD